LRGTAPGEVSSYAGPLVGYRKITGDLVPSGKKKKIRALVQGRSIRHQGFWNGSKQCKWWHQPSDCYLGATNSVRDAPESDPHVGR